MSVADRLQPFVVGLVGDPPPVELRFWDGSAIAGDRTITGAALELRTPRALRRLLWAPNELGLGRAYVAGELDATGDIYALLSLRDAFERRSPDASISLGPAGWVRLLVGLARLGVVGAPLPPPAAEVRLRGRAHSRRRDAAAIRHHYDVGNDFYRLVLGPTMTYSCGYFDTDAATLDEAQTAKYDLVCRKLGLQPGMRLLDVGSGWGGMVLHAARHYGVHAVGITISEAQATLARQRVADAGLDDRVEIRRQDYRDVDDGPFDAISSIGMFEHVGLAQVAAYLASLRELLRPQGRLLNHAISRTSGASQPVDRDSFIGRYVFPDGELHEVGRVVTAIQDHGLEVRDVESLREHYARTLRHWVANLHDNWSDAVRLVGAERARVWRLYMAASAVNFEANRISIHQTLAVKTTPDGTAGLPATRERWLQRSPLELQGQRH